MRHRLGFILTCVGFIILITGCTRKIAVDSTSDDGEITIAIIQLNDVYEISGVSGGNLGNLARVQGYYDSIATIYPNTMMVHAGDFLNPSLINTLKYEGERIQGRQMVEVMNAMSLHAVAIGNHEFDLDEADLQKRLDESRFPWIATNLGQVCGDNTYPFYRESLGRKQFIPRTITQKFVDADGTKLKVGIFSSTLEDNQRPYVRYFNPDSCAYLAIRELLPQTDVQIGLTHLNIDDDLALAKREPEVDLILGGHDHDHMYHKVGNTVITKADANAKTVYLHLVHYNHNSGQIQIESELVEINRRIKKNTQVAAIIDKWNDILEKEISQVVANPYEVVYTADEPLDGRESSIRHHQTNLGMMMAKSMLQASSLQAEAAILNSGGIRIDDQLSGDITAIDIFRVLPFGGSVVDVEMTGALLRDVLDYSNARKGTGGYLQRANIEEVSNGWTINGATIDPKRVYRIALNDFLLTGYDISILTRENIGLKKIDEPTDGADPRMDIRVVIIDWLKKI